MIWDLAPLQDHRKSLAESQAVLKRDKPFLNSSGEETRVHLSSLVEMLFGKKCANSSAFFQILTIQTII